MSFVAPPGTRRGLRDWTELIFRSDFSESGGITFMRSPGMWRSNQPGPSRVRRRRNGDCTIINRAARATTAAGGSRRRPAQAKLLFWISRRGLVRHLTRRCSMQRGSCSPRPSFRP